MNSTHRLALTLAISIATVPAADAHHGRDFIVVQDYALPSPLSGNVLGNFDWERTGSDDEFNLEGGFFLGLAPRLGLETVVSFTDEDGGWDYSSVDPSLVFQLTPPDLKFPIRASVSAGYQIGAADEAGASHHHEGEEPDEGAAHGDEADHHADAEADGHDHTHRGIHRHGEDFFHARLILETDFTDSLKGVFNLIAVVPDSGSAAWGYSAGLRYSFTHAVAAGVEAIGDFADHGEHEVLLAGYFSPVHSVSIKLGAGVGLTSESPDFALHTGVVWRF